MHTEGPLYDLLAWLAARRYDFVTPTPSTSRRMVEQAVAGPRTLRDIFGWSLPFTPQDLDAQAMAMLQAADGLISDGDTWSSAVRVSRVHERLFLHSAFPATAPDAVFLGPDTYRFANLIANEIGEAGAVRTIFDVGAGAGVGGLVAQRYVPDASVILSDVNPGALALAQINAAHAGVNVQICEASGLEGAPRDLDLIVSNPPYVAGRSGRLYKDGGDLHGARLSLDWAVQGMTRLAPGGRFILYTGSAILQGGVDQFKGELEKAVASPGFDLRYREIDPDIFSGELRRGAYANVERIAAIGAVITRSR